MTGILNSILEQNLSIFQFLYGLLYFTFGLSVLLHSRHFSRLVLAKSLPWLGGFGILTSLYEWGNIYLPYAIVNYGQQYLALMLIFRQLLLAFSLLALFQFGIDLLRPFQPRFMWVRLVPTLVFYIWLVGPFILGFSLIPDIYVWDSFVGATTRLFICIPASIFSVVGLIHQQRKQIKPMKLPLIDVMIRFAAGALAAFGLFGGLFGPKTFYFPGTIINSESFAKFIGFPPHVLLSIAGIVLLISMIRILEIFDLETEVKIRNMEAAQVVANERERIARDLHDGALQQVYASGLMAQSLKRHVKSESREEVDQLINVINQAIEQLREFLPKQKNDLTTVDLAGALLPKIEEARQYLKVDTTWETHNLPALSIDQARHLAAFMNEALSNTIRHSQSDRIEISVKYIGNRLVLDIRDFGHGISPSAEQGYGLKNMHERARLLGAELRIDSEIDKGTLVRLELWIKDGTL